MALIMFVVASIIGYPLFMIFTYLLAKVIFSKLESAKEKAQKKKVIRIMKARRVSVRRQPHTLIHA